jgi:hypothetical protein
MAARFVGGHDIHRDHKGDPKERPPIEPVAAKEQRAALELIAERIFNEKTFRFSPDLLKYLAASRWRHWGSSDTSIDVEFPIHDRILQIQLWTLFDLINPRTLNLIADAEMRIDREEDAITIPELYDTLSRSIWSEIQEVKAGTYTNRKPLISSIRRNLQHEYVTELVNVALEDEYGMSPHSARTQAWYHLKKLAHQIAQVTAPNGVTLDDYSRAHLEETARRIQTALEATYSRSGSSSGGGSIIILGQPAAGSEAPEN